MARKPQTTAIANWKEEMAQQAKQAVEAEKLTGGGKFFSTAAGILSFDDTPLPGNMIACIIVDSIAENVFYGTKYDPDNRTPPKCFAFSRDEEGNDQEIQPHPIVDKETDTFERQADECDGCPMNEWGSADTGRGKACGNRRRLAIIPAGAYKSLGKGKGFDLEMFDDPDIFAKADLAFMKLPVTSVKGYSQYVHSLADQFDRPPHGVFTTISLEQDPKSQFKVVFELLEEIPDELMPTIMARHKTARKEIAFPYTPFTEDDAKESTTGRRTSGAKKLTRPAAKKR